MAIYMSSHPESYLKSRIRVVSGFRASGFAGRNQISMSVSGFGFRRSRPTLDVGFGFRVLGFVGRNQRQMSDVGFKFRASSIETNFRYRFSGFVD